MTENHVLNWQDLEAAKALISGASHRSAWSRGVAKQAIELLDDLADSVARREIRFNELGREILDGADCWSEYSYGGYSLIYDEDIAERYCTPSELRRKDGGRLDPNSHESWLDVQTRACCQAARMVRIAMKQIMYAGERD